MVSRIKYNLPCTISVEMSVSIKRCCNAPEAWSQRCDRAHRLAIIDQISLSFLSHRDHYYHEVRNPSATRTNTDYVLGLYKIGIAVIEYDQPRVTRPSTLTIEEL